MHSRLGQAFGLAVLLMVAPECGGDGNAGPASGTGGIATGGAGGGTSGGAGAAGPACDTTSHSGEATYYDSADGSGNCLFPATPNDLMVGAMNHVDYAGSAVCGACVSLSGPQGTITIRVVDQCPECPQGDIDLSPSAFSQIAELSAGRVPISWRHVPCDVQGPIIYHFKDGSNPWWTAVQIRNHRNAVATFEVQREGGAWDSISRVDYNYFVDDQGMGDGPYAFRVTDVYGHVLEDTGIGLTDDGDVPGTRQFPPCE
ncbi:MAG: hypothetical protein MUF54_23820 [Polyangiaceae bacterium]|jgi:expansin (peptidoglycan-binding protein)|nr:hypothetical protein [Polyangiaceae bacterium]